MGRSLPLYSASGCRNDLSCHSVSVCIPVLARTSLLDPRSPKHKFDSQGYKLKSKSKGKKMCLSVD